MKQIWRTFARVVKVYSLEEKVLSVVSILLLGFFSFRGVLYTLSPEAVFADSGVYTEGLVSSKPVLVNPLYKDFSLANRDVSALVFSGLLKYDPKIKGFVDDLASLKISEDKKEYLFTLNDRALWHDGKPVTVEDVLFTFGIIQNEQFQNPLLKANFQGVKVEKIDEKSLKFVLNRPNSFFITNLNVGILPKHILENVAVADLITSKFNLEPIGSGPYKLASPVELSNDGKQKVSLVQFENYFGVKSKIKLIRMKVYPDETALLHDKASLNIVPRVVGDLNQLVYDNRFKTESYSLPQYNAVFFNSDSAILKSAKARIALVKLINKDELLKLLDNKIRVDTPLMELEQKEWLNKADLNEANGALFDAGYKFKKDSQGKVLEGEVYRRAGDGKELELTLMLRQYEPGSVQEVETSKMALYLVEAWKVGGVKVNLRYLPETEYMEAIKQKNYDMILAGQNMGYNLDTYPFWHSVQIKEDGLNLSKFASFAADQQIEKIRETFDKVEKESRQKKLAEIISNEVPALFLFRPSYVFLTDGKVKNISLDGLAYESDRFVNVADWCIGKECK